MKLSPSLTLKAVASIAIAALSTLHVQAQASPRTVRVTGIAGDAHYAHGGGSLVPLAVGTKLVKGDVIKTGVGSHVDLDMGDNTGQVQLAPHSSLAIDEVTSTKTGADLLTETQLSLNSGTMYARVNKLAKGSRYEIATPNGIAGIRGSTLSLTADGQLTMGEGEAAIAYGPNDVVVVKAGETVGPKDRPPRQAPGQWLSAIVHALRDSLTHGLGRELRAFVPPVEPFISPALPGR